MKRFIAVGLGTFGAALAERLFEAGHEVVAIDIDENRVDEMGLHVTRAVVGDARDHDTLEQIGAGTADAGIVSTGDDMSASILATLGLQDLGVAEIYVKVTSHEHARIMQRMGVTETVLPERDTALDLAMRIARGGAVHQYVHIGEEFSIQEMDTPESWAGQTLRTLDLHRQHRISVIAIHDVTTDEIASPPDPDTPLRNTDTLLIAGRDDNLRRVTQVE